jgi:hypothetical protein
MFALWRSVRAGNDVTQLGGREVIQALPGISVERAVYLVHARLFASPMYKTQ